VLDVNDDDEFYATYMGKMKALWMKPDQLQYFKGYMNIFLYENSYYDGS
jgi:hypothetical protein